MLRKALVTTIFTLVLGLAACDATKEPADLNDIYLINEYSETRNPAADLELAVREASQSDRNILIEVGGEWCAWCHILDDFVSSHPEVANTIKQHFVFIKVNYSDENENQEFLGQYPDIPGYPHFFVLSQQGEFIHSQGTLELEKNESYSEESFLAFLERWRPDN